MSGGASAANVFWAVAGATALNTSSTLSGNILEGGTPLALNTGAVLNGDALSLFAVTLNKNTITSPTVSSGGYAYGYGYGYLANPVTGISLNESSNILIAGATDQLTANITPSNATTLGVTWTSSNPSVASVSQSGLVTAVTAGGPVTITATANDATKGTFTATDSIIVNSATVTTSGGGGGGGGGGGAASSGGTPISTTPSGGATSGVQSTALRGIETQLLNLLIQELKAVLLQAQTQGMVLTSAETAFLNGSSMATTPSAITRNLTIGSRGSDVTMLQTFLISQAKGSAASALSAAGATGYFGQLTQSALAEYQKAVGVTPPQGYFGSITREYLKTAGF
jgi:hypothetical protein